MLKKQLSALLIFAVALVTVAPPVAFAQTLVQPAIAVIEPNLPAPPAKPKSDLRRSLSVEVAKIKAGPLTEADFKRLEKERQNQQSGPTSEPAWTRKHKILITLVIVLMTGALVVAYKHRCKAPKPCPVIDSSDYSDY